MALKIRLRQQGRNNRPFYRLVLTDVRAPRDGKYIESLGWYNPFESELDKSIFLDAEKVKYWLSMGAQLSERAESLVAKVAPTVISANVARELALRAKSAEKRKIRKKAAAA